jgi:integrase
MVEVMRDRLRVVSAELPPRPDEPADAPPKRRAVTLSTPPGPATFKDALSEACAIFDAVMAGQWRWPDPGAPPIGEDPNRLSPLRLEPLIERLKASLIGEQIGESTWDRTYRLYFARLLDVAAQRHWPTDRELIETVIRQWSPNSRSRQMAHDRLRRLWKEASWGWPDGLVELRGNGTAAANPEGVRAFGDEELHELRLRLQRSYRLTPADLVAWDCLIVFGLRPAELQGLEVHDEAGLPVAHVSRSKKSSKGSSGARTVPAVPPAGWPADCFDLVSRWREHGLPLGMVAAQSPGQVLTQQLRRLRQQKPAVIALDAELTAYSCRHGFALRLAQQLGLHVRESAELMGHSPAVHLSTYGRRLETPKLLAKVRDQVIKASGQASQTAAD